MTKANKPEPKSGAKKPANQQQTAANTQGKTGEQQKNAPAASTPASARPSRPSMPPEQQGKQSTKNRRPTIGGTAITGAKSTIPKEIPTSGPPQDRPELYNRDARRRMQHMGTGPYTEKAPVAPARKRIEKRAEERKKRQEAVKKTVVTKGPSTNVRIGNKNTYFLLTALSIVVLIIVIALIIRHPF
jgi:predicted RND superfamily exporter protein